MSKILVLDDDRDILEMLQMALTINNFEVDAISRWQLLDTHLQAFEPDIILLDVSLSGADGREICKKLKASDDTSHIPVVLFSANVQMGDYVNECNAQAFVAKPFELLQLVSTLNKHIN